MKRRQFLTTALLAAANLALTIVPDERPKVTLNVYVERIFGDKLSDSYYLGANVWNNALEKVKKFYSPFLDLKVNFCNQKPQERSKNHVSLEYTTMEKVFGNPELEKVYAMGGPRLVEKIKKVARERAEKEKIDYSIAEQSEVESCCRIIKKTLEGRVSGFGSEFTHNVWLFENVLPSAITSEKDMAPPLAAFINHELGHALSLPHASSDITAPIKIYKYGLDNFMNFGCDLTLKQSIHPDQIKAIKEYLK